MYHIVLLFYVSFSLIKGKCSVHVYCEIPITSLFPLWNLGRKIPFYKKAHYVFWLENVEVTYWRTFSVSFCKRFPRGILACSRKSSQSLLYCKKSYSRSLSTWVQILPFVPPFLYILETKSECGFWAPTGWRRQSWCKTTGKDNKNEENNKTVDSWGGVL